MPKVLNRTDQMWTKCLRGQEGAGSQSDAYHDLANYLYVVLYNELRKRSSYEQYSQQLNSDSCEDLAEDAVQNFMARLLNHEWALLEKYSGRGRFTSWAAQVARNMLHDEFRHASWKRQVPLEQSETLYAEANRPESLALRTHIYEAIEECLALLPSHYRIVLLRCTMEGVRPADVAAELGTTANAVYILACRAKKLMRHYLENHGISSNSLAIFAD